MGAMNNLQPSTGYVCEHSACPPVPFSITFRTESSERYCVDHFPWTDEQERLDALRFIGENPEAVLLGVQRPPQPDPHSDWCESCQLWHQRRERPVVCLVAGCSTLTDHAHQVCERHR